MAAPNMKLTQVRNDLRKIICDHLSLTQEEFEEHAAKNATIFEMGADSLDSVEILMEFEELHDVAVDDDDFSGYMKFSQLVSNLLDYID